MNSNQLFVWDDKNGNMKDGKIVDIGGNHNTPESMRQRMEEAAEKFVEDMHDSNESDYVIGVKNAAGKIRKYNVMVEYMFGQQKFS